MITKKQALENVVKYLKEHKREYLYINTVDQISFEEKKFINYGKYENQEKDIFIVNYDIEGYLEPIAHFVAVDAETGEILFTATPHGYAEDWEE
ncbi:MULTISPECIES: hypothetical protein [Mesonia]|uniref:Uncharacterized protein n=1 Tax=Mesonia oceanica TaxID=2687242 RepID=A0AC61YE00_9FLAO|nr:MULTISPECIES: hypothetical protein [Mesonia]MAN29032.1 hypothetical protein [Mesonia sp.]MBJ96583.1 hypothetical protein [Flavobacteriaceae bacterium]VVV02593.1 hypothetical protein FVB9532_03900 [Mesonia oceanica]|tara:strand:+ start:633 stop:914 length:282 start_codon:yes stop_codon:yes gene_type:complete